MLPDGNYLFAEGAIIERLKAKMPPEVYITGARTSDDLLTTAARFPGVYVIYGGDDVAEKTGGNGAAVQATQLWLVSLGVKTTDNLTTGAKARENSGKLFLTILEALQGYEVMLGRPLVRVAAPAPILYVEGHFFQCACFSLLLDIIGGPK
jgi:hypothetical protein